MSEELKMSLADKIYEDTKNAFETGDTSCFYETLVALENTNTILHLYYNDNGHIGTWTKGSCWIFKDNLTNAEV